MELFNVKTISKTVKNCLGKDLYPGAMRDFDIPRFPGPFVLKFQQG
jgi:hypothetical protein